MELRFFEIYRSSEYALLLLQGIKTSIALTVIAGIFGFVFAIILQRILNCYVGIGVGGVAAAVSLCLSLIHI